MSKFSLPQEYRKYYHSLEPVLKKPKTKQYSTVVFFFLVIALFGWYAIRPTIQTILYLRREIVDKTDVNKKMDDKINALIEAQYILENLQTKLPTLTTVVPKNPEAVDVARQIHTLARAVNASVSAIQIASVPILIATPSAALPSYVVKQVAMPITLSVDGSYMVLATFLNGLLNMKRIITIDSIAFTQNKSGSAALNTSELRLQLKATAYYQTY